MLDRRRAPSGSDVRPRAAAARREVVPISDFRFPISDFRFPISDFRFPISDFHHSTPKGTP